MLSIWNRISKAEKIDGEELHAALDATEDNQDASEATRALLGFIRSLCTNRNQMCTELVVGGDSSSSMVQIITAAGDEELDLLATAIAIDGTSEEPISCCSARGREALTLVASYWTVYPEAPLLFVPSDGNKGPQRVLALLQGQPRWTTAPMTAAHLAQLRRWAQNKPDAHVAFMIEINNDDDSKAPPAGLPSQDP